MLSAKNISAVDQDKLIEALSTDYCLAEVSGTDGTMLAYAAKLTLTPANITAENVDALRAAGFDDQAIHDICAITAYFAFVNRIADGLGVELERKNG